MYSIEELPAGRLRVTLVIETGSAGIAVNDTLHAGLGQWAEVDREIAAALTDLRRATAEARRLELKAEREHKCPRCKTPKLNRCRTEDGTLLTTPHPERVRLARQTARR